MNEKNIAAHTQWIRAVEALPNGALRKAEESWGMKQVMRGAAWGGGLCDSSVYYARIAALETGTDEKK